MSMGGGRTQTVSAGPSQPNPPSLLPESREGYVGAQDFYKGILAAPPVYGGQRVANPTNAQMTGLERQIDVASNPSLESRFGRGSILSDVSGASLASNPYARTQNTAEPELFRSSGGFYTDPNTNPFFKTALQSAEAPIFENFNQSVMPGIRDRAIAAGGEGGSRRVLTEESATRNLGRGVGDVVSQMLSQQYGQERERQLRAAEDVTNTREAELARAGGQYANERGLMSTAQQRAWMPEMMDQLRASNLFQAGTQQRSLAQSILDAARDAFEEPLFRQSAAAQSLMQAPTSAGYPSGSKTSESETPGVMGTLSTVAQLAAVAAMIAMM